MSQALGWRYRAAGGRFSEAGSSLPFPLRLAWFHTEPVATGPAFQRAAPLMFGGRLADLEACF